MFKKILLAVAGMVMALGIVVVNPVETKAALDCTYDIINNANAQIANAEANYEMAKLNHQACINNYNTLVACKAPQIDIEKAAFDMNNAANVEKWWLDQVNNAKAYLKNITDRAYFEDTFATNRQKIQNLTVVRADMDDVKGAFDVVNSLAKRIKEVEAAIAGYEQQVAACPSFQAQIDALKVTLSQLKAEYEVKLAEANAKAAKLSADQSSLDISYDKYFEDYQVARENHRGDGNGDWLTNIDRYYGK